MKPLIAAGNFHLYISTIIKPVNHEELFADQIIPYIEKTRVNFDRIIIIDDALIYYDCNFENEVNNLCAYIEKNMTEKRIIFITNNPLYEDIKTTLFFNTVFVDSLRISYKKYDELINNIFLDKNNRLKAKSHIYKQTDKKEDEKSSFWQRFKMGVNKDSAIEGLSEHEKSLLNISSSKHKVVAITGHRGSGVTSTAVNLGAVAAERGLKTIIVDLDVDFRSANLYYGGLDEISEKDEDLSSSLIRTLANPQEYKLTTFDINHRLRLAALPYSFSNLRLLNQFLVLSRIIGMISVFRHTFNLCILDLPFEYLKEFRDLIIHIDTIGLCVNNNLYSLINTLRLSEKFLDSTYLNYLNTKSKVIVSKYNDQSICGNEILDMNRVCKLLTLEISDCFKSEFSLAGHISYTTEFDSQIETGIPISYSNKSFKQQYETILLRIIE